jgi:SH3 domain-containing YSC84-like protein 1
MKSLITTLLFLGLACSALAVDKAALDSRIRKLETKLDLMQAKADRRIPAENLKKAQGVVLLDRTKAGLVFAYQGGSGVALVRDPKSKKWSPPAFLTTTEGSFGVQIGGQQSFVVILLMNTNAIRMLTQGDFKFGGDASGSAGNAAGGAEGTTSAMTPLTMVYGDTSGFYGGAAVKGDALAPDPGANTAYYGKALTSPEILLDYKANKIKATDVANDLIKKLDQYSK